MDDVCWIYREMGEVTSRTKKEQKDQLHFIQAFRTSKCMILNDVDYSDYLYNFALDFLTAVSMQTTHSELPGPSRAVGAEGVTGVPGVHGGLGICMARVLGNNGEEDGDGAVGNTSKSSSWIALQTPRSRSSMNYQVTSYMSMK